MLLSIFYTPLPKSGQKICQRFDQKKVYSGRLEYKLKGLVKIMKVVMKARTEMASATGEFAQALYDPAASDLGELQSHS